MVLYFVHRRSLFNYDVTLLYIILFSTLVPKELLVIAAHVAIVINNGVPKVCFGCKA